MKKIVLIILFFSFLSSISMSAIDGAFLGYKGGFLLKIDIAGAFKGKRTIDANMAIENSIPTGIGEYGATVPHAYPRVIEALVAPYGEMIFNWGYKFPKVFSLGFGLLLSNFVMPSLMVDLKFSLKENSKIRPYLYMSVYSGLFDGFPFGITAGGGIDIYMDEHFYFLIETKAGAEIFVSKYYDDGNNTHGIWHFDYTYAYGLYGIYIGLGYQFKNIFTDADGKWVGKNTK